MGWLHQFLDDFVLLYPVYSLLFGDAGVGRRRRAFRCIRIAGSAACGGRGVGAARSGLSPPLIGHFTGMSVTTFQDLPLADRDRSWDGDAAEKRVRKWADAQDEPNQKYRDAHVWYDSENKDNFTAYKLLIADLSTASSRPCRAPSWRRAQSCRAHAAVSTCPKGDIDRVKSHLAKYYKKMGETAPWDRD